MYKRNRFILLLQAMSIFYSVYQKTKVLINPKKLPPMVDLSWDASIEEFAPDQKAGLNRLLAESTRDSNLRLQDYEAYVSGV